MSCCPESAWPSLGAAGYQPKGKIEKVGDLKVYMVGSGPRTIIWNHDIFGWDSGRTRETADLVAAQGFLVLLPDWYRGDGREPTAADAGEFLKRQSDWSVIGKDFREKVLPLAKENGAIKIGSLGTCWGSYCVIRQCGEPEVTAGASWHPAHSFIASLMGEDEKDLLSKISGKQLFMPAGEDDPATKLGGLGEQVLGDRLQVEEFPTMKHGWTVRGDLADPEVSSEVKRAINTTLTFFKEAL